MMALVIALSAALGSAAPVVHETTVEHRGAGYQVSYRPHVTTTMKTVGMAAGLRTSTERCRWSATVVVERQLRRTAGGASVDTILPAERKIRGSQPGSCRTARGVVDAELARQSEMVRAHVVQTAQADRSAVLADIEAAQALALN